MLTITLYSQCVHTHTMGIVQLTMQTCIILEQPFDNYKMTTQYTLLLLLLHYTVTHTMHSTAQ